MRQYWVVRVTWSNDWPSDKEFPTNNEYVYYNANRAVNALAAAYSDPTVEYACITLGD